MVENIIKNTLETLAIKNLNASNELKNAEIKKKRFISNQKQLLNLFDDLLKAISNNKKKKKKKKKNNNNKENECESVSENENENKNENENENEIENENENENYIVDCKIKQLNNYFKMIDESKLFDDQIKLFKKKQII